MTQILRNDQIRRQLFQRLHVDSGPHRIEVRKQGYEPLAFDVRVAADHTTNYQGELKKIQ